MQKFLSFQLQIELGYYITSSSTESGSYIQDPSTQKGLIRKEKTN
jgi:hypothetical protein